MQPMTPMQQHQLTETPPATPPQQPRIGAAGGQAAASFITAAEAESADTTHVQPQSADAASSSTSLQQHHMAGRGQRPEEQIVPTGADHDGGSRHTLTPHHARDAVAATRQEEVPAAVDFLYGDSPTASQQQ